MKGIHDETPFDEDEVKLVLQSLLLRQANFFTTKWETERVELLVSNILLEKPILVGFPFLQLNLAHSLPDFYWMYFAQS